ncbi:MAG: GNAT family N-acetyltransferase [Gammaproteobacteria bacterium]|nr:GNAT family N-acetyltransferase [Gammaproteobacteria bacterium]MDH5652380.1 GNAT family N-acetyltransferase [Gammaproteobacteria bacterium]
MQIHIIQTRSELNTLEPEWQQLLAESTVNSLFMTWEWVSAWLDSATPMTVNELFVITIRDGQGKLRAIAPFYKTRFRLLKLIPLTVLRILGDEGTGGEYPAMIIDREHQSTVLACLIETLRTNQKHWHLIWLARMSGWDGFSDALAAQLAQSGLACRQRPRSFSYFPLPSDFTDFEQNLSSNRRQQFRRQAKKIHASGDIEITACRSESELPADLQILFDLHGARRELLGDAGTFKRKPQQVDFYRLFTRLALTNNWLWLYALRQNGQVRAIQLGYVRNGVFYQIQEGFDPDFLPGAGNVLRMEVIKQCIKNGVTEFDFLGEHTEHKRRWSAVERTGRDMLIGNSSVWAKIVLHKPLWPTGRFLQPVLRTSK